MCFTEETINLMLAMPQLSDDIYNLLMCNNPIDIETTFLVEPVEPTVTELAVSVPPQVPSH